MPNNEKPYVPKGFSTFQPSNSGGEVYGLADDSAAQKPVDLPVVAEVKNFVRQVAPFLQKESTAQMTPQMTAQQATEFLNNGLALLQKLEAAEQKHKELTDKAAVTQNAKSAFAGLSANLAHYKVNEKDFFKALWAYVVEKKPDLMFDPYQLRDLVSELHMDFVEVGGTSSAVPGKGMRKVLQTAKFKGALAEVALAIGPLTGEFVQQEINALRLTQTQTPALSAAEQEMRAQAAAQVVAPFSNLEVAVKALVKRSKDVAGFDAATLAPEQKTRFDEFFPKKKVALEPISTSMNDSWRDSALKRELRTALDHAKSAAIVKREGELRFLDTSNGDDPAVNKKVDYASDQIAREHIVPKLASAFQRAAQNHLDERKNEMLCYSVTVDEELVSSLKSNDMKAAAARAKHLAQATLNRLIPPLKKP